MRKILIAGFLLSVLFFPHPIFAMKINEIMYDVAGTDTGREWIEIHNDTQSDIDFSNWKILENAVNHTVKLINGSALIPAGGFAIIADNSNNFLIDNSNYAGTLFDSAFSLTNTGETLALINSSGNKINEISYSETLGAKGDGNSLQLYEGFLISAKQTPGITNATQTSTPPESDPNPTTSNNESTNPISSHSSPAPIVKLKEVTELEVSIGRERLSSIKTPVIFDAKLNSKRQTERVKYLWNFGDGKQQKGKKVEHSYKYPGMYNVVLNALSGIKHAVSRTIVYIKKPSISIVLLDEGPQIENLDSDELNIGSWILKTEDEELEFEFPADTIISPKNKIIFDIDFTFKNQPIYLYFPNGDLATKTSAIITE
jgi:hypothetical protein